MSALGTIGVHAAHLAGEDTGTASAHLRLKRRTEENHVPNPKRSLATLPQIQSPPSAANGNHGRIGVLAANHAGTVQNHARVTRSEIAKKKMRRIMSFAIRIAAQ